MAADPPLDKNKDGIADVSQLEARQLVTHKIKLVLKSTDPDRVSRGLSGVWSGCAAVVAALRYKMAMTLALGLSVGEMFGNTADFLLRPALTACLEREYHKWIGLCCVWSAKAIGFAIAWSLQRVLSAFHSALRGAELLVYGLLNFSKRHGCSPPVSSDSPLLPAVCAVIGCLGFLSQFRSGFVLPFPLNVILFPLRIFEWLLFSYVASTSYGVGTSDGGSASNWGV